MQMEEVKIGDKTYTVNEVKFKELAKMSNIPKEEVPKKMMMLSTDITEEEYDNLSMRDGLKIQVLVNEINGFDEESFPKPLDQ